MAKRLAKLVLRCGFWTAFALFWLVMALTPPIAIAVRWLRRLRTRLAHSTEWHDADIFGGGFEVRRTADGDALEIRRKERQ